MLVEREQQLRTLTALFDDLVRGHGCVALVSGEGGIGKTTLLNAMLSAAPPTVRVWRGGCDNLVTANPLGPFREALRGATAGDGERRLEHLLDGHGAAVLTSLAEELSGTLPTLLLIEDLHWADDASVDVLAYLARRLERLRLLIVVSFRDEEVGRDHPIHRLLAALSSVPTVRLPLEPLTVRGVAMLSQGSGWDPKGLHEATAGNPFYVTEALAGPPTAEVPPTVAAAVGVRLQRLSPPARAALEQVSVWPGLLEFDLAQDLLGEDLAALTEAEQAGVLLTEPGGIRFRHEIARRATAARLTSLQRRQAERTITDTLKRHGDRYLSRLVHHAASCGDAATVAAYAPRAARRSTQAGAHRQALAFYRAALDHEVLLEDAALADVLDGYAWELHNAHRFNEAVTHGRRAVAFYRAAGECDAEAEALVRLTRPLYLAGEPDDARACAERAVQLTEQGEPRRAAQALTGLGTVCALDVDHATAVDALTRAHQIALQIGDAEINATCLNYLAQCDPSLNTAERTRLLSESLAAAVAGGAHERIARGYTNLAELLYRAGDYDRLADILAAGLPYTREHGFWSHAYGLESAEGLLLIRRGEWTAAAQALRTAVGRYDDPGMLRLYCLPPYLRLRVRSGELTDNRELVDCWQRAVRQRWLTGLGQAGAALMEWAWLYQDPEAAHRVLDDWEPHAGRPTAAPIDGELRRYARLAGVACPARSPDYELATGPWRPGLSGDWVEAAALWAQVGDPYEEALELATSGEPDATIRAWQMLTDLGAKPAARLVRLALSDLGLRTVPRGPNRRTRVNPAGLTERQVAVARMLSQGMTNAEIADHLVVSVRTVDHHVSAILTKLGLSSRRAVAAVVRSWDDP